MPVRRSAGQSDDAPPAVAQRQKTTGSRGKREAFVPFRLGSPARSASAIPSSAAQSPPRSLPARPPAAILPRCHSSSHQSQTRNPPRFFRFHPTRLVKPFRIHGIGRLVPPLPKFVAHWSWLGTNFGSERGTSNFMILVPLFDLKFPDALAASG